MACYEKYFVGSSFINHISWDSKKKSLIVTFASGSIWIYEGITRAVYNKLCSAKSIGSYFNKNIRNSHEGRPVARVGQNSVIIYSEGGDEIVQTQTTQESI